MKKMLKAIVWVLAAMVVILVGGGYLLPNEVVVQRQALINAPPGKVFALVSSFKRFNEWSPWAEIDPNIQYTVNGPEAGVGANMRWASNNSNVGVGKQTIIESVADSRVISDVDLGKMGRTISFWDLKPEGNGTLAIWGFKMKLAGQLDRWTGLGMDSVWGQDYEKGLGKLKALAEKEAAGG
ncbi:MAG: SRPBCC family protein [Aestuariivirga sp.]